MQGYEVWFDAFWELSSNRAIGLDVGPIPSLAVDFWARRLSADDKQDFVYCIRRMDTAYLNAVAKRDEETGDTFSPDEMSKRNN